MAKPSVDQIIEVVSEQFPGAFPVASDKDERNVEIMETLKRFMFGPIFNRSATDEWDRLLNEASRDDKMHWDEFARNAHQLLGEFERDANERMDEIAKQLGGKFPGAFPLGEFEGDQPAKVMRELQRMLPDAFRKRNLKIDGDRARQLLAALSPQVPDGLQDGKVNWKEFIRFLYIQNENVAALKGRFPEAILPDGSLSLERVGQELRADANLPDNGAPSGSVPSPGMGDARTGKDLDEYGKELSRVWRNRLRDAGNTVVIVSGVVIGFLAMFALDMQADCLLRYAALAPITLLSVDVFLMLFVLYAHNTYMEEGNLHFPLSLQAQLRAQPALRGGMEGMIESHPWPNDPPFWPKLLARLLFCLGFLRRANGTEIYHIKIGADRAGKAVRVSAERLDTWIYWLVFGAFALGFIASVAIVWWGVFI